MQSLNLSDGILAYFSCIFGSVGLAAFWTLSRWLYMDFIFFSFLSTQETFAGDGHLFSVFVISLPFLVALHRHQVEKGYTQTFRCTCGCSLLVICN